LITVSQKQWIFQTCGSTGTDSLMLIFAKNYVAYRYRYQQCHCLAALPAKICLCSTVTWRARIQWFQINPNCTSKNIFVQ